MASGDIPSCLKDYIIDGAYIPTHEHLEKMQIQSRAEFLSKCVALGRKNREYANFITANDDYFITSDNEIFLTVK